MNTFQSTRAVILVVSNNASDAEHVKRLLKDEFEQIFTSIDPDQATTDFDQYKPDVLVLAFNKIEKSEHYYLELCRQGGAVLLHPHRTLILCGKDDERRAFQLWRDGFFDDYILFWIENFDAARLYVSVHLALCELAELSVPKPTEFAAQVRRLETLESLLNEQITRSEAHVTSIRQNVAQANKDANAAFEAFSQRLVDGELPDVVSVKDAEGLHHEMRQLKNETIEVTSGAVEKSVQPLKQWMDEFREATARHIESINALTTLANRVQQTLLVVDDDKFQYKIIDAALKGENYRLLFAESGNEAMIMLHKVLPDLILMDVMMPGMSGLEVVRKIKAYPRLADVPIIMLTGKSEKDIVMESLKAGAKGFIVKPYKRDILVTRIREVLQNT